MNNFPLETATTLLANIQRLLAKSPAADDPCKWYAVCWDYDQCFFDPSTIRREPDQQDDPAFFAHPLLFPWVYLPADNEYSKDEPSPHLAVHALVQLLNAHCHWQRNTDDLADIVHAAGGKLLRQVHNGLTLSHEQTTPAPRFKPPTISRHRSQPMRYTKSRRASDKLADHADRSRSAVKSDLRRALDRNRRRTVHRPPQLEQPHECFRPGHLQLAEDYQLTRQEAEDELRNWLGIYTFAEEVVQALELKNEREFLHES